MRSSCRKTHGHPGRVQSRRREEGRKPRAAHGLAVPEDTSRDLRWSLTEPQPGPEIATAPGPEIATAHRSRLSVCTGGQLFSGSRSSAEGPTVSRRGNRPARRGGCSSGPCTPQPSPAGGPFGKCCPRALAHDPPWGLGVGSLSSRGGRQREPGSGEPNAAGGGNGEIPGDSLPEIQ